MDQGENVTEILRGPIKSKTLGVVGAVMLNESEYLYGAGYSPDHEYGYRDEDGKRVSGTIGKKFTEQALAFVCPGCDNDIGVGVETGVHGQAVTITCSECGMLFFVRFRVPLIRWNKKKGR